MNVEIQQKSSAVTAYYVLNAWFNSSRAVYISTYSLFLVLVLQLKLEHIPWLLVVNLLVTTMSELPTGAYADLMGRRRSFLLGVIILSMKTPAIP